MADTPQTTGPSPTSDHVPPQIIYQITPPPPQRGFFARIFISLAGMLVVGVVMLVLLSAVAASLGLSPSMDSDRKVQEKFVSHEATALNKVAIISIEGVILESEEGFAKRQIDRVMKDDNVKAVVLRVNSPGGSVTGSDYLYHHLRRLAQEREIPLVVSMGGLAASGGYYVSMAVGDTPNTIFAEPTGYTGSIGVVIPHYNFEGLLDKVGAEEDSIASHPLKMMGSLARPMSDEERKIFEKLVAEGFDRFKEVIRSGRPAFQKDPTALDRLATGQIYTSQQALQGGLVDRIGFVEDAVDRAIELAHLDADHVKVVKYKQETGLASLLMGEQAHQSAIDVQMLLDMTTPRAFYLCTWLPGLGSAKR